jgi:hypothetical protein
MVWAAEWSKDKVSVDAVAVDVNRAEWRCMECLEWMEQDLRDKAQEPEEVWDPAVIME